MSWKKLSAKFATFGIAALCFGYFASYIPYSMMTKMLTKGLFSGMNGAGFSGFEIQPVVVLGSFSCMFLFLTLSGWWKFATHSKLFGISFPRPQWFTFLSGICTAGVIITTTLAYTFSGVSIVFAMLLMRGGVLVLAPIIDAIAVKRKRKIYWPSWVASGLSLAALFLAFTGKVDTNLSIIATIDISLYLTCYFVRLFYMSNRAKSTDPDEKRRYFTEEQLVANTVLPLALIAVALVGSQMSPESIPAKIYAGFVDFPSKGYFWQALLIGVFSYGTGLFGSLIFLDKRENTFTVPANRASSVVSGVIATYLLSTFYGQNSPSNEELIGVILIIGTIFFLGYRSVVEKKRAKKAAKKVVLKPATEVE